MNVRVKLECLSLAGLQAHVCKQGKGLAETSTFHVLHSRVSSIAILWKKVPVKILLKPIVTIYNSTMCNLSINIHTIFLRIFLRKIMLIAVLRK
jgi:hypothetical protein